MTLLDDWNAFKEELVRPSSVFMAGTALPSYFICCSLIQPLVNPVDHGPFDLEVIAVELFGAAASYAFVCWNRALRRVRGLDL